MKKILFVLDCLKGGGAQRFTVNLLKHINKEEFTIDLVLVKAEGEFLELLPVDINVHNLNSSSAKFAVIKLVKTIKKINPDLIFSTLTYINILTYFAVKILKSTVPVIMRSSNLESVNLKKESNLTKIFIRKAYNYAEKVVVLTKAMKNDFIENFKIPAEKVEVIPNMVDIEYVHSKKSEIIEDSFFMEEKDSPVITAVGNLSSQKGYEYLIKAFAELRKNRVARLVIIGEGVLRKELEQLSCKLGVRNDVYIPGFKNNPFKYIGASDIFIMPSLWEGFPNVLIESMACSVPVVVADCPGIAEIITNGLNGVIVSRGSEKEILSAIEMLLNDAELRRDLAEVGVERTNDFAADKITHRYEELIKKC